MEPNKRIEYMDVARGLAMLLIFLGHTHTIYSISRFCYLLNLSTFIIISGYFFNKNESLKLLLKKSLKIMIPALIVFWITRAVDIYYLGKDYNFVKDTIFALSKNTIFDGVNSVGIVWYIPFLVMLRLVFYLISKISKNNIYIQGGITIVLTGLGIYLANKAIYLPWSFDLVLCTLVLFYIGHILKEKDILNKYIDEKIPWIVITIVFWTIFLFINRKYWNFEIATRRINPFGLFLSVSGCLMLIKVSYLIEKYLGIISKPIKFIGKNSYWYFLSHSVESKYAVPNYWINVMPIFAFSIKIALNTIIVEGILFIKNLINKDLTKGKEEVKDE